MYDPWDEIDRQYLDNQEDEYKSDMLYALDEAKSLLESAIDSLLEPSPIALINVVYSIRDVLDEIKDTERELLEEY